MPDPKDTEIKSLEARIAALEARPASGARVRPNTTGDYAKDFKDGNFKDTSGKAFRLRIVEDDPRGRTHKLKTEAGEFWEGNKEEFRAQFEKA